MKPKVSFIVPCYNLAHLLTECVNSILAQTYRDFEILIMDDASPDDTPEVARSFQDSRVRHIRNNPNLGHLRNYNKGIELAQGDYVWLISADDYLRKPYVLERYVSLLDAHPEIGYVFCPGVKVRGKQEGETLGYSIHGDRDQVFAGQNFFSKLAKENTIVAASGLVRKKCYEQISVFPLDRPWGGDWYLWAVFALHYDVGYLAEPMVCYREHETSMTNKLMTENVMQCSGEDISMPWAFRDKVLEAGHPELVLKCLDAAAYEYARRLTTKRYRQRQASMDSREFETSLKSHAKSPSEERFVRARVEFYLADYHYWQGDISLARECYARSIRKHPWQPSTWIKWLLASTGSVGLGLRKRRAELLRPH